MSVEKGTIYAFVVPALVIILVIRLNINGQLSACETYSCTSTGL